MHMNYISLSNLETYFLSLGIMSIQWFLDADIIALIEGQIFKRRMIRATDVFDIARNNL